MPPFRVSVWFGVYTKTPFGGNYMNSSYWKIKAELVTDLQAASCTYAIRGSE